MKKTSIAWTMIAALLLSLVGCGSVRAVEEAAPAPAARQDGERFEAVIMLEGMEETVQYEHVRNEAIGFEMDYEYEALERRTEEERECFVSLWDDPEAPWNYLEVRFDPQDADTAAAAVRETLADAYDTVELTEVELDGAGPCVRIDASGAKDGKAPGGSMQSVYVIPAGEGSIVAAAHCTFESAEGFGASFAYMVNTLLVIGRE